MTGWTPLPLVADCYGVTCRALEIACHRITRGHAKTYHGIELVIRCARATNGGGRSGFRYEIKTDSLPAHIQDRLKERTAIVERPVLRRFDDWRAKKNNWLLLILSPAMAHHPKSPERRAAIAAIVSRPLTDWNGQQARLSERTIQRWLASYEAQGAAAFAPRARADKGRPKVIISLAAEQAIPFDTETWEGIAAELRSYVRGHWKQGATLKLIEGRANIKFRELIAAAGFSYFESVPGKTFLVPRRFVVAERPYRNVHTLHHDRKTYEDNRFRTKRSRAGMMPMDWVIFDVHPVDVVMMRADGSTAHARMIAWLDGATNRMRFDLVLCEPGTGIRNADMIQGLLRTVAVWGMPKTLYLDNGQENNFADDINDALQLVAQLRGDDGRTTRVVRAQPYNASAKPIEGMFAALEKMLQDIPGHTGGDRMNKKTERVGRPTKAFPGTLAQLNAIIQGRILEMETYPMRGALAGRSPRQAYQAAIDSGWQPVAVDPREILTVFAIDRLCKISKGVIAFDTKRWHCEELASYFEDKVIARVPRFWPAEKLPLLHLKTRELIGIAEPVPSFAFDDPAGARLSKHKDSERRGAIRALDRGTPDIDTVEEGLRIAAMIPPAAIATPIATISISSDARQLAAAQIESRDDRAQRLHDKSEREHRKRLAILERAANKGA
jgi:hypothetical protein